MELKATVAKLAVFSSLIAAPPCFAEDADYTSIQLSKSDLDAIDKGVRGMMRDPDSAKLGKIAAATDGSTIFVCLMVNARNGFGGYTGEQPFVGILSREVTPPIFVLTPTAGLDPSQRARSIRVWCANRNMAIT